MIRFLPATVSTMHEHRRAGVRRVVVAMSGGVDSSVAAALLREQGHEVVGATLKLQDARDAPGGGAVERAREVACRLGIPHHVVDAADEFDSQVLRPAWDEYASGRTPSPCLLCNERIKLGSLLAWARRHGASLLATGHYARVERSPEGGPVLLRGADRDKDQSYFLAGLDREQLSSVFFPLGGLEKAAVRELARNKGLPSAETAESQDACIVGPDGSFAEMLRERFGSASRPGSIVDETGRVLGRHDGIHRFTVGQRRGIHVPSTARRWVKALCVEDAVVVVTDDRDALLGDHLVARGVSWIGPEPIERGMECEVQIRYRHVAESARIEMRDDGALDVTFSRPVWAITPGQAAVFYDGDRVLGRGWIDSGS